MRLPVMTAQPRAMASRLARLSLKAWRTAAVITALIRWYSEYRDMLALHRYGFRDGWQRHAYWTARAGSNPASGIGSADSPRDRSNESRNQGICWELEIDRRIG